jgi:dynein heavy chain
LYAVVVVLQVADLQTALKEEQIIVEEKKAQTDELIVSIGKEKAVVDEAVEAGREDEEAATKLAEEVQAFQEECTKDLAAGALQCPERALSSYHPYWCLLGRAVLVIAMIVQLPL